MADEARRPGNPYPGQLREGVGALTQVTTDDGCVSRIATVDALRRLRAVADVARAHHDVDQLLPALLEHVRDTVGGDEATVLLLAGDGSELATEASCGLAEEAALGVRVPIGSGVTGRIAAERRPMVFDDLHEVEVVSSVLRRSGIRSLVGAPLLVGGDLVGVVHVGSRRPTAFGPSDAELIALVADWIALAVANARLQAEHAHRERAARFLADAVTVVSTSLDLPETLRRLCRLCAPFLADWCSIHLLEGDRLRLAALAGDSEDDGEDLERLQRSKGFLALGGPGDEGGLAACSGFWPSVDAEALARLVPDPDHRRAATNLGLASAVCVPLTSGEGVQGVLLLARARGSPPYTEAEAALARDLAFRAGAAVANARLFARLSAAEAAARELAGTLQRTLLPPTLPRIAGVDAAAAYHPAGTGTEVAGDFYDLFSVPGDRWLLVVGDVRGKGPVAASVTALARYSIRTAAMSTESPAEMLVAVNEALLEHAGDEGFFTVALVRLTRAPGGVAASACSAGHPPPLVVRASGTVETVGYPGLALGLFADLGLNDTNVTLRPGDALVLYTDGVTEARFRDESTGQLELFGFERLAALLERATNADAATLVARVEHAVLDFQAGRARDDIAVLAVRLDPHRT